MFLIVATKSLNDNTRGFRFNVLGFKGLLRLRKALYRRPSVTKGRSMTALHWGRLSVYAERRSNKRRIRHFAG
jgi:hypothetical protein